MLTALKEGAGSVIKGFQTAAHLIGPVDEKTRNCAIVVGILVLLAISVLAGLLTPGVGTLGGLTLGSFNLLLLIPVAISSALVGVGIGALVGWVISVVKSRPSANNAIFKKSVTIGAVIGLALSLFLLLAASHSICQNFSRFSFSYGKSLVFAGHAVWISVSLLLVTGCLCFKKFCGEESLPVPGE